MSRSTLNQPMRSNPDEATNQDVPPTTVAEIVEELEKELDEWRNDPDSMPGGPYSADYRRGAIDTITTLLDFIHWR